MLTLCLKEDHSEGALSAHSDVGAVESHSMYVYPEEVYDYDVS